MKFLPLMLVFSSAFHFGRCLENDAAGNRNLVEAEESLDIQGRDDECSCNCFAGRSDIMVSTQSRLIKYREEKRINFSRSALLELEGHTIQLKKMKEENKNNLRQLEEEEESNSICDCMCDSGTWIGELLPGLLEQSGTGDDLPPTPDNYGNYGQYGHHENYGTHSNYGQYGFHENYGTHSNYGQYGNYGVGYGNYGSQQQYGNYRQYGNYAGLGYGNYGSNYGGNQYGSNYGLSLTKRRQLRRRNTTE